MRELQPSGRGVLALRRATLRRQFLVRLLWLVNGGPGQRIGDSLPGSDLALLQ